MTREDHSLLPAPSKRENEKRILRERAKDLARIPEPEEVDSHSFLVVEFQLAKEHYAIEMEHVCEVHPLKQLTPLPGTPMFVMGIINVRGQILTVIDIKQFFDLPRQGLTELNQVIVVQHRDLELGILADVILGVQTLPRHNLQPALSTLTGVQANYLSGITPQGLMVLNVAEILSDDRILVQDTENDF